MAAAKVKRLLGQMQHHGAILANGIKHDRLFSLGHDFAHDVNALGLKPLKMGKLHGDRARKLRKSNLNTKAWFRIWFSKHPHPRM